MKLQLSLVCALVATATLGCGDDDATPNNEPNVIVVASDAGDPAPSDLDGGRADDASACGAVGRSVACTGRGGCAGAQVCRADGTFAACACDTAAPAASSCGQEGTLAMCLGQGGCTGLELCGDDGRYGPCECPAPPSDPARAVTALEITAPAAGASVMGVFEVAGTAAGHVAAVYVSIGGGPLLIAEGTEHWTLRFDPAGLPEGPIAIVARAVGEDGGELQRWIQVYNTDPLVGTWYRTSTDWDPNGDWYCVLKVEANGEFVNRDCEGTFVSGYSIWNRLHGDVIAFRSAYGSDPGLTVLATLSSDGENLVIKYGGSYYYQSFENYVRVHGDPPPPPDRDGGFDPYPDPDRDSGSYPYPDTDAGF